MSDTNIPWADKTWNPITGCSAISEGCEHCYARLMAETRLRGKFGYSQEDPFAVTFHTDRLEEPLHWRQPRSIFVCSMGDLFHQGISQDWLDSVTDVMVMCPEHTYLLLTKRPANIEITAWLPDLCRLPDLYIGVTIESQKHVWRLDCLVGVAAGKKFLSIEPMLGPITIPSELLRQLSVVIVGGESGPGARPMDPEWVIHIKRQCDAAGVLFYFKQWGPRWGAPGHQLNGKEYRQLPWKVGK